MEENISEGSRCALRGDEMVDEGREERSAALGVCVNAAVCNRGDACACWWSAAVVRLGLG
jgi:hypothetical protein